MDQQIVVQNQQQRQLEEVILKNHTLYHRIQELEKEKADISTAHRLTAEEAEKLKEKLGEVAKQH